MNIDILEDNPPWWNYFWVLLPTSAILIFLVLFLKHRKKVIRKIKVKDDEENQLSPRGNANQRLFHAAEMGHLAEVGRLLKRGASINYTDQYGQTPLMCGVKNSHVPIVSTLLNTRKINVNLQDSNGFSALHWAVISASEEIVESLVYTSGLEIDIQDTNGMTPTHHAAYLGRDRLVRFLTTNGRANLFLRDKNGYTPLHSAVLASQLFAVYTIIEDAKTDINAADNEGLTPLHLSYKLAISDSSNSDSFRISEVILDAEYLPIPGIIPSLNIPDASGNTILHTLSDAGATKQLNKILGFRRTNVNATNNKNRTPLVRAIMSGREETALLLLQPEWGAEIDSQDSQEWTALHHAANMKLLGVVKKLVEEVGASVAVKNRKGDTPRDIAERHGNMEILEVLERAERKRKRRWGAVSGAMDLPGAGDVLAASEVLGFDAATEKEDGEEEDGEEEEKEEDGEDASDGDDEEAEEEEEQKAEEEEEDEEDGEQDGDDEVGTEEAKEEENQKKEGDGDEDEDSWDEGDDQPLMRL